MATTPQNSSSVTVNYWAFIAFMVALSAFGSFVNDMYTPSLPAMTDYFHCSPSTSQLGLTFGMIGLSIGQIILGPLSDKLGRKPVLLMSMATFLLAAVVSIFSPTIHFFLWCRLVQGVGASGGYFMARTMPADVFGGRELAKVMAIIGAINGFAPACAPVLGGIIADAWGWRAVFVTLSIIAVILLLLIPRMKETLPVAKRFKGSFWQSFSTYPKLLRNYRFMIHVLLKGAALGLLFAYISSATFIMQRHYGFSQTHYGLTVGANSLIVAVGATLALRFKLLKNAAVVGAVLLTGVIAMLAWFLWHDCSFLTYELLLLAMLFCLGMIFTASNTLAMNEGRQEAGVASAILGVGGYLFGAVVSPLVGHGNIMHSTAIVFAAVTALILISAILTARIPPDLNQS